MNVARLMAVARKEAIQLRRDPRSMVLAFALPLFMLLFFGYAITWDVKNLRLAVVNEDGGQQSRAVVQAMESSGYFYVVAYLPDRASGDDYLEHSRAAGVLIIPADFTRKLAARKPAPVQLLLDGSDANTATIALNYANAILARYSRDVVLQGQQLVIPVTPEPRIWYNPTLASRNMIVPGLVAVIMSIIAAMLTALTIAREWERGTMEQLAATPVSRAEVILGKLVPYLVIGLIDVAIAVILGVYVFQVPFRGSLLTFALGSTVFLIGVLGLGTLLSTKLKSQLLASQAAIFATYLPALLFSGFMYTISNMPVVLQWISSVVPAKYYVSFTRGVFLKGNGLDVLWPAIFGLAIYAGFTVTMSIKNLKKELT